MPLQIFCTISFSNEEGPRDAETAGRGEDRTDEFLYGQKEDEEEEEDTGAAATDFVAFASSCTLHGLSHIFVEGTLGARQALWAVAFLLSLSVFLYQVADRIVYYLEYHHVTLLSEEESPEMTFPAVTFCNINRVRVSQLSHEDVLYLAPLVDYEPGMELGFSPAQPGPGDEDEPLNLYGFFNRTCHQLEDMLLSCSYRGERCGPSDFAAVSSPGTAGQRQQLRPHCAGAGTVGDAVLASSLSDRLIFQPHPPAPGCLAGGGDGTGCRDPLVGHGEQPQGCV